jgi:hypothetical protein
MVMAAASWKATGLDMPDGLSQIRFSRLSQHSQRKMLHKIVIQWVQVEVSDGFVDR